MRWSRSGEKKSRCRKSCGNDMVRMSLISDWRSFDHSRYTINDPDQRSAARLSHPRQQESRLCQAGQVSEIPEHFRGEELKDVRLSCKRTSDLLAKKVNSRSHGLHLANPAKPSWSED